MPLTVERKHHRGMILRSRKSKIGASVDAKFGQHLGCRSYEVDLANEFH